MLALTWWGNQYGKTGQPLDLSWLDTPLYFALAVDVRTSV
jgi:hypothetical protein